jgi:hypothetical protein
MQDFCLLLLFIYSGRCIPAWTVARALGFAEYLDKDKVSGVRQGTVSVVRE